MKKRYLSGAVCAVSLIFINSASAAPIAYDISGSLALGDIGSSVPTSFVSAIDSAIFGSWTGSLIYDADTAVFSQDITTIEGLAGKYYTGGITDINIELNNGIMLSSSNTGGEDITVYTGDVSSFPASYSVGIGAGIPDTFWLAGSPPAEYAIFASTIRFQFAGVDPVTTFLGLPPQALDDATNVFSVGAICGDFNNNGVNTALECVQLTSTSTGSISAVPIPAAVWMFGSGLIGLIGVARRKKY